MASKKKEEPKAERKSSVKGIPMTEEQKKAFEKTWQDMEECFTKARKSKKK